MNFMAQVLIVLGIGLSFALIYEIVVYVFNQLSLKDEEEQKESDQYPSDSTSSSGKITA